MNPLREKARSVIGPIIHSMRGAKRQEIRSALRKAYTSYCHHGIRIGQEYKIWCDEVAISLRERGRRPRQHSRPKQPEEVMPAMRAWAMERGLIEVAAEFDVDGPTSSNPADSFFENYPMKP